MKTADPRDLTLDLRDVTEDEITALSQFVKRIDFEAIEQQAVDRDEAYVMRDAIVKLQTALAREGYSPR